MSLLLTANEYGVITCLIYFPKCLLQKSLIGDESIDTCVLVGHSYEEQCANHVN